ncbi:MAG: hypothetical protein Kow00109_23020 [Acidobacteriota bacterium]
MFWIWFRGDGHMLWQRNLFYIALVLIVASGAATGDPLLFARQSEETAAEVPPVVLEELGPLSVLPSPSGLPAGWTLVEKRYVLRNRSSYDIVFYSLAGFSAGGALLIEKSRASYPPDDPPVVAAGTDAEIVDRYLTGGEPTDRTLVIDSVVFADGSSYGPNTLHNQEEYLAMVEAQYVYARHLLDVLDTQRPEALRELLLRKVRTPSSVLSETARAYLARRGN